METRRGELTRRNNHDNQRCKGEGQRRQREPNICSRLGWCAARMDHYKSLRSSSASWFFFPPVSSMMPRGFDVFPPASSVISLILGRFSLFLLSVSFIRFYTIRLDVISPPVIVNAASCFRRCWASWPRCWLPASVWHPPGRIFRKLLEARLHLPTRFHWLIRSLIRTGTVRSAIREASARSESFAVNRSSGACRSQRHPSVVFAYRRRFLAMMMMMMMMMVIMIMIMIGQQ